MPNLHLLSLTAASLFAIASSDTYVSPEQNAVMVFTGVEFCKQPPDAVRPMPRTAIKKNAIATRFQMSGDDVVAVFPRFKCGLPVTVAKKTLVKGKIGPKKSQILAKGKIASTKDHLKENCHPKKNILKGTIVPKRTHLKGMSDPKKDLLKVKSDHQGVILNVESGPKKNLFKEEIDPKWAPVPTWELHQEAVCDCLQSAVDIFVDANDHAWILDSGFDEGLNETEKYCPPKVVVVDMKKNLVQRQIDLAGLTCPSSRVQYLAVEQTDSGRTFVYVSDATNNAILVWDVMQAQGFKVTLPDDTLTGYQDDASRDVLYMVMARHPDGSKMLAITYLSSCVMFTLRTEFLRRAADSGRVVARGLKPDKMVLLGSDGGPGVFFRYTGKPEIYRWDTRREFEYGNFIKVYDGQPHRLATCVAPDYKRNQMLVLESNFQCFANGCVGSGVSHTLSPMRSTEFIC